MLLLTDLYYLDHYGNSAHFPGHAVVLAGYDEEVALLSDTGFEELQDDAAREPRQGPPQQAPRLPARRPHVHRLRRGRPGEQLREAIPAAIERAAKAMLEPEFREFSGLDAVRRLSEEAGGWPEVAEDWQWCARFGYQVIERRGTGGGAFRLMYSRFLEEAGRDGGAARRRGGRPLDRARRRLPRRQRERGARTRPLAAGRLRRPAGP